jgi:hypothetical protein
MFRDFRLGKDEDPEILINNLEDLRVKSEAMGSIMTDYPFMIQTLNSLTAEYDLQILLLEKRIGNKGNPFSVEELKEELNLRIERLSSKNNDESGEEKVLFIIQFKGKCRNCGKIEHKAAQYKSRQVKDNINNVICNFCKKSENLKANYFEVVKKNQVQGEVNSGGPRNNVAGTVADLVLSSVEKYGFKHEIWVSDSGASCQYCNNDDGLYNESNF